MTRQKSELESVTRHCRTIPFRDCGRISNALPASGSAEPAGNNISMKTILSSEDPDSSISIEFFSKIPDFPFHTTVCVIDRHPFRTGFPMPYIYKAFVK